MTKRKIGGLRNFAVEIESAKLNVLGLEFNLGVESILPEGKFVKLGTLNNFTEDTSFGSIQMGLKVPGENQIHTLGINLASLEYKKLENVETVLNGKSANGRCKETASVNHLEANKL
jgi:hypothetical protein